MSETHTMLITDEQTDQVIAAMVMNDEVGTGAIYEGDPDQIDSVVLVSREEAVAHYHRLYTMYQRLHAKWINAPNPGQDTLISGDEEMRKILGQ